MYAQTLPLSLPIPTHRFHTLAFSPKSRLWLCNSSETKAAIRCGGSQETRAENLDDAYYMRRCVELARKAIGCTSPNPMVGCVIVKNGEIVGEGFHPKAGQPHAEVKLEFDSNL